MECGFCHEPTTKDDKCEFYCNACRINHAREDIENAQKVLWELLPPEEKPKNNQTWQDRKNIVDLHSTSVSWCHAGKCDICNERKFKALFPGLVELIDSKIQSSQLKEEKVDNSYLLTIDLKLGEDILEILSKFANAGWFTVNERHDAFEKINKLKEAIKQEKELQSEDE